MGFSLRQSIISFLQFSAIILLIWSCAKPVAPTGGPKDETPPEIVRSLPPNGSTNYIGDEIIITFNEFVKLKDINNQLVISPPVREIPDFKIRGKSLIVTFNEPRREETTYNLFFGDAIQDITESNPVTGFKFTFSTGPVLDSMMIEGKLINAFNLTPVKGAYVMLYDSIYDSVPYKQLPYYISRTNDQGEFLLTNLRDIPYKIFALTDINANYIYDQRAEEIAFISSLIHPWNNVIAEKQSEQQDTINETGTLDPQPVNADSVVLSVINSDSLAITDTVPSTPIQDSTALKTDSIFTVDLGKKYLQLFHFREIDSVQSLLKAALLRQNVLSLNYKLPVSSPQFRFLDTDSTINPVIEKNNIGDTLTIWLPDYEKDSIMFELSDNDRMLDTIEMSVKPREKPGKKNETAQISKLQFSNNLSQGKIKPGSSLRLTFTDPVLSSELNNIILIEDSIQITSHKVFFTDSIHRKLMIRYPWKQGISYLLTMNDSIFSSVFGYYNDSVTLKFSGFTEEETSMVTLDIDLPENSPYIIQLLDPKEKLIEQYAITEDATLDFRFLKPGKYKFKAIDDRNGNGYWDTGKYLAGIQPERVIYFNKELELRANWTLEEKWQIPEPGK